MNASAWLIKKDGKRADYYIGWRFGDHSGSFNTGILKKPVDKTGKEHRGLAKTNSVLAEAALNLVKTIFVGARTEGNLEGAVNDIATMVAHNQCCVTALHYLVTVVKRRARRKKLSLSQVRRYCMVVDSLLQFLKESYRLYDRFSTVSSVDLTLVVSRYAAAGHAPETINRFIGVLRSIFNEAIADRLTLLNPARKIPYLARVCMERRPFTLEEIQSLIEATFLLGPIGIEWRLLIYISLYTGMRMGDACTIKWKNFDLNDLKNATVTFYPGKTKRYRGEPVVLGLPDTLVEVLTQLNPGAGDDFVIPNLAFAEAGPRSTTFLRLMELAGIETEPLKRGPEMGTMTFRPQTFYSTRHSTNTFMRKGGVDRERRQKRLGQTTVAAQKHYEHDDVDDSREDLSQIPKLKVIVYQRGDATPVSDYAI